ncbi:MAG: hypothetical protein NVS3B20_10480 [Polyangiales bacterium]
MLMKKIGQKLMVVSSLSAALLASNVALADGMHFKCSWQNAPTHLSAGAAMFAVGFVALAFARRQTRARGIGK